MARGDARCMAGRHGTGTSSRYLIDQNQLNTSPNGSKQKPNNL